MPESTIMETEKKAAMDYAIRLTTNAGLGGNDARNLAAKANLVGVLYRAMMSLEIAKPEVIDALLKASV